MEQGIEGVVAACSYETRKFGVHSAMPVRMARELCPEAIIRENSANYSKYSNLVTDVIKEQVPVYEKTSVDEFYADLTGMDRFGTFKFSSELRDIRVIQETGLPINFGLSSNKTVSKVATGEAKPNNKIYVEKGLERPFLAPLSVRKIPMVGEKTYQTLRNLGCAVFRLFKKCLDDAKRHGQTRFCNLVQSPGVDQSAVIPYQERKSISTERTFAKDTIDVVKLEGIIVAMAENLAYQLRRGDKLYLLYYGENSVFRL